MKIKYSTLSGIAGIVFGAGITIYEAVKPAPEMPSEIASSLNRQEKISTKINKLGDKIKTSYKDDTETGAKLELLAEKIKDAHDSEEEEMLESRMYNLKESFEKRRKERKEAEKECNAFKELAMRERTFAAQKFGEYAGSKFADFYDGVLYGGIGAIILALSGTFLLSNLFKSGDKK